MRFMTNVEITNRPKSGLMQNVKRWIGFIKFRCNKYVFVIVQCQIVRVRL
jgi:hypothetical protein